MPTRFVTYIEKPGWKLLKTASYPGLTIFSYSLIKVKRFRGFIILPKQSHLSCSEPRIIRHDHTAGAFLLHNLWYVNDHYGFQD